MTIRFLLFWAHASVGAGLASEVALVGSDAATSPPVLLASPCHPCSVGASADLAGSEVSLIEGSVGPATDTTWTRLTPLHDDAVVRKLGLPFSFPLYYATYDTMAVGVNGFVTMLGDSLPTFVGYRPSPFPCNTQPRAVIAPLWKDLEMGGGGAIRWIAAEDSVAVEWDGLVDALGGGPYSFRLVLGPDGDATVRWRALGSVADAIVGWGDAEGTDGLTWPGTPAEGKGIRLVRGSGLEGIVPRGIRLPARSFPRDATVGLGARVANAGDAEAPVDLRIWVRPEGGADSLMLEGPLGETLGGGKVGTYGVDGWTPSLPGVYELRLEADPGAAIPGVVERVQVVGPRDSLATLSGYDAGNLVNGYALFDPGRLAVRFLPGEMAGLEITRVRVAFWRGWPDFRDQDFELELRGVAAAGGAPGDLLAEPILEVGRSGTVSIPIPPGTVAGDTVFVVIRQLLPFPDADAVASDPRQDASRFPRHWIEACDGGGWEILGDAEAPGDLAVELWLGSPGLGVGEKVGGAEALSRPALLGSAYPVPANPRVFVPVDVSEPGHWVRLAVYDAAGRRVALLWDGPLAAGRHSFSWEGALPVGRAASGVYILRLESDDFVDTRRIVILR